MKLINLLLLIIIPVYTFGQNRGSDCKCPVSQYSTTKADTIFYLPDGHSIALCGAKETGIIKGKKLYREFVLSVCGSDRVIKFWDAMQICNLKTYGNTLIVETLEDLPVGKFMALKETPWTMEYIYFVNNKVVRDSVINSHLPKYNPTQISYILNLYERLPNNSDYATSDIMDRLFIATISGSKKSRYYLINFEKKFTNVDGVYAERYDTIMRMLKLWDTEHPISNQPDRKDTN